MLSTLPRTHRVGAALLLAAVFTLSAAGCTVGSAQPSASVAQGTTSTANSPLAVWQKFAACARAHGQPNFPDPQIGSDGQVDFGSDPTVKAQISAVHDACSAILDKLPASAGGQGYTAADLAKLLKFAKCMRANGVPQWPDPKADGTFPIVGTPLEAEGKSPRIQTALQACQKYWDRGIAIS
ncbi:hypothetical protein [Rathayibacter soli]|uniref:hypothetical protein n=1 Tax=Rathayibacter soli TaxID=3144168 RepID=UPI0027E54808|nr:hypothetical protein [Glaciibacter superstes]